MELGIDLVEIELQEDQVDMIPDRPQLPVIDLSLDALQAAGGDLPAHRSENELAGIAALQLRQHLDDKLRARVPIGPGGELIDGDRVKAAGQRTLEGVAKGLRPLLDDRLDRVALLDPVDHVPGEDLALFAKLSNKLRVRGQPLDDVDRLKRQVPELLLGGPG